GRGDVVALVGERTIPVARLVAGKLRTAALPIRLCYAGPVLSTDEGGFQQRRETYQVGAELVGASGPVADAEVIALAARCMEATGIRRYQIDVGHAEFFHGIMDAVRLPDEVKAGVRAALAARDFVALESLLEGTPLKSAEHELLLRFPALLGRPAPATGFMIQLDLVSEMLTRAPRPPALKPVDAALAWTAPGLNTALRLGSTLRLFGMRAVVDTQTRTRGEAKAWWHAIG